MSFANEFKRAVKGIEEEIAHYREFQQLEGMPQHIAALEELRDKWSERTTRFAGRGKLPTEPFDWADDKTSRRDLKENMTRIIKAAAAAAELAAAESLEDLESPGICFAEATMVDSTAAEPNGNGPRQNRKPIPTAEGAWRSFLRQCGVPPGEFLPRGVCFLFSWLAIEHG